MFTFESVFIFTLFGEFERWVVIVHEGRTLTIPRLPSAGFKKAKSGVWGRQHIKKPPTAVWGDLKRSDCVVGFGSACKERKAEVLRTSGGGSRRLENPRKCPNFRAATRQIILKLTSEPSQEIKQLRYTFCGKEPRHVENSRPRFRRSF